MTPQEKVQKLMDEREALRAEHYRRVDEFIRRLNEIEREIKKLWAEKKREREKGQESQEGSHAEK